MDSSSLMGQLEAHFLPAIPAVLVPVVPLLSYPVPTPCGTSPTSRKSTGKDEGMKEGELWSYICPYGPERVLETSHLDFVGPVPYLGPQWAGKSLSP